MNPEVNVKPVHIYVLLCMFTFSSSALAQMQPLQGVIDVHIYASPDSIARSIDAIDLAKSRGMRAMAPVPAVSLCEEVSDP